MKNTVHLMDLSIYVIQVIFIHINIDKSLSKTLTKDIKEICKNIV